MVFCTHKVSNHKIPEEITLIIDVNVNICSDCPGNPRVTGQFQFII